MSEFIFTIIIPHHNTPKLLERLLNTIPDCETIQVIVIDDNSDAEIVDFGSLERLGRKYTQVVFTKEGRGAGYARNVGLSLARGKWLLFADSDDYFEQHLMQKLSKHIESKADMVLFKAKSVDCDTLEPAHRNENINNRIDEVLQGKTTARQASIKIHSPWCRLIKRDFVLRNGIKFDEIKCANDTMFTTKCTCQSGCILVSDAILYVVTYRKGSLWHHRKSDPDNYLTRLKVMIDRNYYVKRYGFDAEPIWGMVIKANQISLITLLRALCLVVSRRALFQGLSSYFAK